MKRAGRRKSLPEKPRDERKRPPYSVRNELGKAEESGFVGVPDLGKWQREREGNLRKRIAAARGPQTEEDLRP